MQDPSSTSFCCGCRESEPGEDRRCFFSRIAALSLGALVLLVPAAVSIVALLNPLRQKSRAGKFMRLASLETLPEDGTPRKFPVIADRSDAWNYFPSEKVGSVFLRQVGPGKVEAIQVVCPHAGCFVGYDAKKDIFFCPCHAASFDLGGKRLDKTSPSPRDLDTLEVEVRQGSEVWVKFQNFQTGTSNKIAEG